jgi:hypothetical protein
MPTGTANVHVPTTVNAVSATVSQSLSPTISLTDFSAKEPHPWMHFWNESPKSPRAIFHSQET